MFKRYIVFGFLSVVASLGMLLGVSPAVGSVEQYSAAAAANPNAIVQYGFDGDTDLEQRQDSVGDNDLNYFGGTAITFGRPGFDWSSEAFRPNRDAADGLITSSAIDMPTSASFDAIVRPGTVSSDGFAFAGRASGSTRDYWLLQNAGDLRAGAGSNYDAQANIADDYTVDDWYYVAVTMSYDGSNTTINSWSANLSSGQRTLSQTSTNYLAPGSFVNNVAMGVGILNNNGNTWNAFVGDIDEISLYSGMLSEDDFQSHLDEIYIPEPATLLIWSLLAGLAIGLRWRRK